MDVSTLAAVFQLRVTVPLRVAYSATVPSLCGSVFHDPSVTLLCSGPPPAGVPPADAALPLQGGH